VEPTATAALAWPSTPERLVLGHMGDLIRDGLIPFMDKTWRAAGDCYEFRVASERIKVVVHPDDVEALLLERRHKYIKGASYDQFRRFVGLGLVTSEGELWRRQRRIIQPSFRRDTVRELGGGMGVQVDRMLDRWAQQLSSKACGTSGVFDVHAELMRLTLEIIAKALFQLELHAGEDGISSQVFSDSISTIAARITAVIEAPSWLPTAGNRKLARAVARLDHVVMQIIDARRRSGEDRDDLLGALLRARDDEDHPIDDKQLRDEVVTMFLAGHETTAVSLGWTLWLLTQNPDVRVRMVAEIDAAIGRTPPMVEDIPKLGYVKQVFLESMRVIAPVWGGARNCIEHDTLGKGFPVEPGDRVMNVIWLTHKHPEFWPDPDRFDPDRFEPQRFAAQHKFAYLPFADGPRKCAGEHFATMEAILVLTRIFQRFELDAAPGFVPEMDFQLTTRPRHGLMMTLRERE
jgi:cytochrome P450